jgi:hypothetical protein
VDVVHKPVNKAVPRARIRLHLELKGHRDHLEERVHLRTVELAQAAVSAPSTDHATGLSCAVGALGFAEPPVPVLK